MFSQIELEKAADLLRQGRLVAFPTETVYGLGANANNSQAVQQIFSVKGRPADHPIIVHLPNIEHLASWAADISLEAQLLAKHFWPGPLTLILKKNKTVSNIVTGGQDTVGLRIPSHPVAQALLKTFNGGIAAPSANRFGHISPTTAEHVRQELRDKVDLILDGGPCSVGIESTIVDCSNDTLRILRPGIITASQISDVLHKNISINHKNAPRVSGHLESHYAPQTTTKLISTAELENEIKELIKQNKNVAVLARYKMDPAVKPRDDSNLIWIELPKTAKEYAYKLYAQLRHADNQNCEMILVEEVPDTDEWAGIRDRLKKASTSNNL